MIILLNSTFELANGVDRCARVCEERSLQLAQATPSANRLRAEWPTLFPDRATREVSIPLLISLPECATAEDAEEQAHAFIVSLPKGGDSLTFTIGERVIEYTQWSLVSAEPETIRVRNYIRVMLRAVNPQVSDEARAQFESAELQEFEANTFT